MATKVNKIIYTYSCNTYNAKNNAKNEHTYTTSNNFHGKTHTCTQNKCCHRSKSKSKNIRRLLRLFVQFLKCYYLRGILNGILICNCLCINLVCVHSLKSPFSLIL